MSDGKILSQPENKEPSAVDILLEVNNRLNRLESKQKEFENLSDKVNVLQGSHESVAFAISSLASELSNVKLALHDSLAQQNSKHNSHCDALQNLTSSLNGVIGIIRMHREDVANHDQSVATGMNRIEARVAELKDSAQDKSSSEAAHAVLSQKLNSLSVDLENSKQKNKDVFEKVQTMSAQLAEHAKAHLVAVDKAKDLGQRAQAALEKFAQDVNSLVSHVEARWEEKVYSLKQRIDNIPQSVLNMDQVKEEITKAHESIGLDAQSAVLRSKNLENQVKMIDKKLENVLLQIKSLTP